MFGSLDFYGLGSSGIFNLVIVVSNFVVVVQVVELLLEVLVIVILGGGFFVNFGLIYNVVGLFDFIVNVGLLVGIFIDFIQNQVIQSYYQGVLGSIVMLGVILGIYDGLGVFVGEVFSLQFFLLFKFQFDLIGFIVEDIVNQNVVGGLILIMV